MVEWNYDDAFKCHKGLLTKEEQEILRNSTVAIAGMGGVGGIHLITLARLGIENFIIADSDIFNVVNFNRQYGAKMDNLGLSKAESMAKEVKLINPNIKIRIFNSFISKDNVIDFLDKADIFVDGIDFYNIYDRRLVYNECYKKDIWCISAGPLGFSTVCLNINPKGMSFDQYFDINDKMSYLEQLVSFAVGITPKHTHTRYMKIYDEEVIKKTGPSLGLACNLCSGMVATEVIKVLLNRGNILAAPWYLQFDAYRYIFYKKHLWWGNKNPIQKLKRWLMVKHYSKLLGQ